MFIGIDLGTSSVKLILTGEKGEILKTVSKEYPLLLPKEGWSEQDPKEWYEKTIEGMKELVGDFNKPDVEGIGVGGQMHGLVLLDEKDEVIRPAILWNDGRTTAECDYLNKDIGKDKLRAYTGNIAFAGFTAPKILWVKNNEPENFKKIRKIMLPKDYLVYRLTGAFSTDFSDASGMLLLDVEHKCWSKEMLDICGITEDMLPTLHESFEVVGEIKESVSEELGFPCDANVVAGAGDNAAAAVGCGVVSGSCNISLGTSGTVFIAGDSFFADDNDSLHSFAHADGGYHLMGCMLSAASCLKWWMDEVIKSEDYSGEQEGIEGLGDNPVIFLPYLMGERSPHNDPDVRGMFYGLSMRTGRREMLQAVLEGVAFGIRDSYEACKALGMKPGRITICGGGAKSPLWKRIMANVLNADIISLENDEGPALGGAVLAMVGCGVFDSVKEASTNIAKAKDVTRPEPDIADKYETKYQIFRSLYPAIKDIG